MKLKLIILLLLLLILIVTLLIKSKNDRENFKNSNNNNNLKICVLMWYNDEIKNYADMCYKINSKYCKKYGYDIIKSSKVRLKNRKPHFERLPLILEIIQKYDYVIWIDADAHFYSDSPPIHTVINEYKDKEFIFSGDLDRGENGISEEDKELHVINSGFIILKNTEFVRDVVNEWTYSKDLYKRRISPFQDQGVIRLYLKENIKDIMKRSKVIPFGILQKFSKLENMKDKYANVYKNYYDKFNLHKPYVIHYAGINNETRLKLITEYYNKASL